jgi:perosamine synthetase
MNTRFKEPAATREMIPLSVPEIRGNEWSYVKECLDTGWVSSVGPFVERFERSVADFVGTKYAVATVNGTSALHVALRVAGVEPADEVLVSAVTFIAPAYAVRYLGAFPVFIDAEPNYWQMDPQQVIDFLEKKCEWKHQELRNRTTGRRVRAILPVHILGHPVDVEAFRGVANKYGLPIVEDATESLGARYRGRLAGTLGDVACFSFNGNKIITTGGGGMIVTNDEAWARKAKYLTTQAKDDPLEYVHNEIGYNYRLTNLLAAMGCAQMEQLPAYIAAKRRIASLYSKALECVPGITPMREASWAYSTFWLYTILIHPQLFGMNSRALLRALAKEDIQTRPLWQPIHLSKALAECGSFDCPVAEQLNREALSLPCSVGITDEDLQAVIAVLTSSKLHHD